MKKYKPIRKKVNLSRKTDKEKLAYLAYLYASQLEDALLEGSDEMDRYLTSLQASEPFLLRNLDPDFLD